MIFFYGYLTLALICKVLDLVFVSLFQDFSNFCFYMFENFIDFLTFLDFFFLFIGGVFKHLFLSLLLLLIYLSFMLILMMMFDIYTHTTSKLGLRLKGPWLLQAQKFQLGYCYVIWHCSLITSIQAYVICNT